MTELFYPQHGESFKAGCHATMAGLAAVFTLYNSIAWLLRHERHLARNAAIYAGLTALELYQVGKHTERTDS